MNFDALMRHFDAVSEAPDAIPQLRRFILNLAVRGKLVEQYSGDEPALELLKEILSNKTRLIKEGKLNSLKNRKASKVERNPTPFGLPQTWTFRWTPSVGQVWGDIK